jgi:hypothetical protein
VEAGPSFGAFLAQQFTILSLGLLAMAVPAPSLEGGSLGSRVADVLVYSGASALAGTIAAMVVRKVFGSSESGKWIWVIPTLLIVIGLLHDSFHFSFAIALGDAFLPAADGEAWWVFMFLTLPAVACGTYSATMSYKRRVPMASV